MIHDGPEHFPNSCVDFEQFSHHSGCLQDRFAQLREAEAILQRQIGGTAVEQVKAIHGMLNCTDPRDQKIIALARLHQVQRELLWMANNANGSRAQIERKRRGAGAEAPFLEQERKASANQKELLRARLAARLNRKKAA